MHEWYIYFNAQYGTQKNYFERASKKGKHDTDEIRRNCW
jgi:hypothetical protein